MFNMRQNAGDNAGYQLRITYNTQMEKYMVTGFIVFMNPNNIMAYDRDGATLMFNTMQEAIDYIVNYKERN